MSHRSRCTGLLLLVGAMIILACSDSTTAPSSALFALHFDSLFVAANTAVQMGDYTQELRASATVYPEIATAFGAIPRTLSVTTATGVERWSGLQSVIYPLANSEELHSNRLVVYRDRDLHTVLTIFYAFNGAIYAENLVTDDTIVLSHALFSGASSILPSRPSACATPPTLANPDVDATLVGDCATATFSSSASLTFHLKPGVDPALAALSFPATTFRGEQFYSGFTDSIPVHQAGSRRSR